MEHLNKELEMWQTLLTAMEALPKEHRSNQHTAYLMEVKERAAEIKRGILHVGANKNKN